MKTAIIRKYTVYGTFNKVYSLEYRGKHLTEPVSVHDKEALGKLVEYALNSGFTDIKFIDSTVQGYP